MLRENFLATLLDLLGRSDIDSSSKAKIVKAIKSMQFDGVCAFVCMWVGG